MPCDAGSQMAPDNNMADGKGIEMTQDLEGKVALVTGGSRGIGREISKTLAEKGALVAVHYGSNSNAAAGVVRDIEQAGGKAFAVQADLAKAGAPKALFAALDKELKDRTGSAKLDILVNNAGIAPFQSFAETKEADFDRLIAVNLRAPFFLAQEAASRMNDGGRIVNLSTVAVRLPFGAVAAYSVSKGGVDVLTRVLAAEFGERNITVNAVAPGAIQTDMAEFLNEPEGVELAKSKQALKRVGQPEEIAEAVGFLASPSGRWVTGQVVEVSGGTVVTF